MWAKIKLKRFGGIFKKTFYLHLKECEFRFNHRNEDLLLRPFDIDNLKENCYAESMETTNLKHVGVETRRKFKELIVNLHNKGKKGVEIAELLNISEQAVSRVVRSYKKIGLACLNEKPRGRVFGAQRTLVSEQEEEILRIITEKSPDVVGIAAYLWSRAAIQQLIRETYGINMPLRSISNYLNRWGMTCQRPTRKAYYQDEAITSAI